MALTPWATHVIQWPVQRVANPRGGANLIKTGLSSDWRLQLASMKLESLVNVGQHTTLNTFPGLVHTARHTTKVGGTRSAYLLSPKVNPVIGVKS
jgi:hypothetical protein